MRDNKKGTDTKPAPKIQFNISKLENTCLIFFAVFVSLVLIGEYKDISYLSAIGFGIGITDALIMARIITAGEDDEDEID